MQSLSLIITTNHTAAVLALLAERGIFTGNEPGSRINARYGDLHIAWHINTYGEVVKARADIDVWCEHAKRAGLISESIIMVINAGDEPAQLAEHRTLTLVSQWAAVCEDILSDLDFTDLGDASIVLVDQDGSTHDYWRLTARVESNRALEVLVWCEQARQCRLLEAYELL